MEENIDILNGISRLTNLKIDQIKCFFDIIKYVSLNQIACNAADKENGKLTESKIRLPSLGLLKISYTKNGNVEKYTFLPEATFQGEIEDAVKAGESKLVEKVEQAMVKKIVERYESLI